VGRGAAPILYIRSPGREKRGAACTRFSSAVATARIDSERARETQRIGTLLKIELAKIFREAGARRPRHDHGDNRAATRSPRSENEAAYLALKTPMLHLKSARERGE
jgi:hypothetical protein